MEQSGFLPYPEGFSTLLNHAGQDPENWDSMCVIPPIVTSTTFKHLSPTEYKKYEYSRSGNPTRECLETCLAAIEKAKYAVCFSSGVGAGTTLMSLFRTGDHILVGYEIYGGLHRLFTEMGARFGIEVTFVDCLNLDNVKKAIKPNTKAMFMESPSNPTLKVFDIKAIGEILKKYSILFIVDNTFLTAYLQRPLELGVDISFYSMTKYLNGHSDVVMGAMVTNDQKLYENLKYLQNAMGIVPSPFDCYQVLRGLKTLAVRMKQHSTNSYKVAKFLETHPKILKVVHPCLESHPQYEISKKQTSGHSGMLTFYLKSGADECAKFFKALKLFHLAGSLGGTESLIALPSTMTHAQLSHTEKLDRGITDNCIRISVGIEDVDDLIDDLKQALNDC